MEWVLIRIGQGVNIMAYSDSTSIEAILRGVKWYLYNGGSGVFVYVLDWEDGLDIWD